MRGHPRANGSTSRWKKLSTYTQARSPPPRTLPPLPPPDLDEEGRVDNQRNTPHNTPLTVQLTVATSQRDLPDVAVDGVRGQVAHLHVFDHSLAQWCHDGLLLV